MLVAYLQQFNLDDLGVQGVISWVDLHGEHFCFVIGDELEGEGGALVHELVEYVRGGHHWDAVLIDQGMKGGHRLIDLGHVGQRALVHMQNDGMEGGVVESEDKDRLVVMAGSDVPCLQLAYQRITGIAQQRPAFRE